MASRPIPGNGMPKPEEDDKKYLNPRERFNAKPTSRGNGGKGIFPTRNGKGPFPSQPPPGPAKFRDQSRAEMPSGGKRPNNGRSSALMRRMQSKS